MSPHDEAEQSSLADWRRLGQIIIGPSERSAVIVPAWVLPLQRLRRACGGDLAAAWARLPAALPPSVPMPGDTEAATMLWRLDLV